MARTMEESEKLYFEAKRFFADFIGGRVLIEISDRPMCEWRVLKKKSNEEMSKEKRRLLKYDLPFIGFGIVDGLLYYQYSDENLFKGENPGTGVVEYFYDNRADALELAQVGRELNELVKYLSQKNSNS